MPKVSESNLEFQRRAFPKRIKRVKVASDVITGKFSQASLRERGRAFTTKKLAERVEKRLAKKPTKKSRTLGERLRALVGLLPRPPAGLEALKIGKGPSLRSVGKATQRRVEENR